MSEMNRGLGGKNMLKLRIMQNNSPKSSFYPISHCSGTEIISLCVFCVKAMEEIWEGIVGNTQKNILKHQQKK